MNFGIRECDAIANRDKNGTNPGENITGLYEYDFQWNMNVSEQELVDKLRQPQGRKRKTTPKICAVGDSHGRWMHDYSLPALKLADIFDYIKHFWINPEGIVQKIQRRNCDIFFVQQGLWPASSKSRGQPFPFGKYHDRLKLYIENILGYNPNATIYLPTIDQGPIFGRISSHIDWRTPTMLDGFSYVNQMLAKEINQERGTVQVHYIDTNFIIYSHFDGHEDWQHLMEKIRSRKTIYVLAEMLGESPEWLEETCIQTMADVQSKISWIVTSPKSRLVRLSNELPKPLLKLISLFVERCARLSTLPEDKP